MIRVACRIGMVCAGAFLFMLSLLSFGVTTDLAPWRLVLGTALFCGALVVWDRA